MSDPVQRRRVTVMSPATRRARAAVDPRLLGQDGARDHRAALDALEEGPGPTACSLLRRQLTVALPPLAAAAAVLFGGPVALRAVPGLAELSLLGVGLPWILVAGAGVLVLLLAWRAVRRSEALEEGERRWNRS